jgi:hypothetical protein
VISGLVGEVDANLTFPVFGDKGNKKLAILFSVYRGKLQNNSFFGNNDVIFVLSG